MTRGDRPPRKAESSVEQFIDLVEQMIRVHEDAEDDGPTEKMEAYEEPEASREDTQKIPLVLVAARERRAAKHPPPTPRERMDEELDFESDVDLLEDSLMPTQEMSWIDELRVAGPRKPSG